MQASAALLVTAAEVMGGNLRRDKVWITEDVLDLCDERMTLKLNGDKNINGKEACI